MEVALKDFFRHNGVLILIIAVLLALITLVTSADLNDLQQVFVITDFDIVE